MDNEQYFDQQRDGRVVEETSDSGSSKTGILIGFLIVSLLIVAAIVYACILYRRLMISAEFNRRVSSYFGSKFSQKKKESTDQCVTFAHDDRLKKTYVDETPKVPPREIPKGNEKASEEASTYLDMSAHKKVHDDGTSEEAPIYETLGEQEEAPAYASVIVERKTSGGSLSKGKDNPIYENLDQDATDPVYVNITPSVTPVPSPSHSPRTKRKVTKQESDAYVMMSGPGGN